MKNVSKRQYILTLIVSFVAIVVLSLCTIMTFYRKSVNDTLALAAETVKPGAGIYEFVSESSRGCGGSYEDHCGAYDERRQAGAGYTELSHK